MNKILGFDLDDLRDLGDSGNTKALNIKELLDLLSLPNKESFIDFSNRLINEYDQSKLKKQSSDELKLGDNVTYINQHGVSCKGYYYGSIHGEDLCKDTNGDIHVATNITKQLSELSKQEAKNKICNILETQANPNTIQKVIDIVDRIK